VEAIGAVLEEEHIGDTGAHQSGTAAKVDRPIEISRQQDEIGRIDRHAHRLIRPGRPKSEGPGIASARRVLRGEAVRPARADKTHPAAEIHRPVKSPGEVDVARRVDGDTVGFIVAGVANRLVFSFMARSEIKTFNDLKGKKIGITRLGSSTHSVTLWVMNRFGLKPDDYQLMQLVDVPNIFTAMMAGQIDAGALSPPTNFRGRKVGLTELIDLSKEGPEYVSVAIGSTRSFLKNSE